MKCRPWLLVALLAATYPLAAAPQGAATAAVRARAERALEHLPDWGGIWTPNQPPAFRLAPGAEQPLLTAPYAAILKSWHDAAAQGNEQAGNSANCVPPGMPTVMIQPYAIEFLFTPGRVTIIQEAYMQVRRVFTDRRGHRPDLDPTFNGHSIGHWEGDTLVIDTVAIKSSTVLDPVAVRHSDKLHIIERVRLASPDQLELQMTMEDAEALKKPWHVVRTYTRHRDWDLIEYICEENNRNPIDMNGHTTTILRK
jgi:hypothetical protein